MIILASASPRRSEILSTLTKNFKVISPEVEEIIPPDMSPTEAVVYLARLKAEAVQSRHSGDVIIAADTLVELNGEIFGKPTDTIHSEYQLGKLSGSTHNIHTGVAIISGEEYISFCTSSTVTLDVLSEKEIKEYIATGEPADKAGSYAIQGIAGRFITEMSGDYYATVGLPINSVYNHLKRMNIL